MSTLADEFLADAGDEHNVDADLKLEGEEVAQEDEMQVESFQPSKVSSAREVSKLLSSKKLENILQQISKYANTTKTEFQGSEDPEYELIVQSNDISMQLTYDINNIHSFIRMHYSKRFPELESLVLHPLDYARIVRRVQNNTSSATIQGLNDILPAANIITLSMAASSTSGNPLDDNELKTVIEACDIALELDAKRQTILSYVEGRMLSYAPNLSALVGSEIATKLIGAAGGLDKLATMPSGNLFVIGKKRSHLSGFSSATVVRHHGFIADSAIIKNCPSDLQLKACRLVANKSTLAARLDYSREQFFKD
eukprot:TRINITY_DN6311_c0_g1_i3.p1 TRINITY_DN6311_c0_g1~~TRINITY_DN6311_c0_g1_i3.p1  ORF type:complete len:311 (+),score=55.22 TRINITY_DN6311_c0_g1_i3:826-1758(+)